MSDERLHIAHLLLTDRFAGSERYAIDLANIQSRHHRVSMILAASAAESRSDALAHRLNPSVEVHLVDSWKLLRQRALRKLVQHLRPDVAHGHLSEANRALGGLPTGSTLRVSTLHIHYKAQQHRRLDGVIAIAPWQVSDIPRDLPHVQINNWNIARPAELKARERIRASLGIGEDVVLFGALGRVEESKGLDVLISAWKQAQTINTKLAIVGHGRDWDRLRAMAPADIAMPGFAERPQDWMAAFDVFVSAARSEPFGLVFLEAMQSGLPIVASDSEGARHLAPELGRPLLPRGDVTALADFLRQTAASPPQRETYDLSQFQPDVQADRIEAFYRQLIAMH